MCSMQRHSSYSEMIEKEGRTRRRGKEKGGALPVRVARESVACQYSTDLRVYMAVLRSAIPVMQDETTKDH